MRMRLSGINPFLYQFVVVTGYLQVFISMHPLIETSTYKAILSRAQGELSASLVQGNGK